MRTWPLLRPSLEQRHPLAVVLLGVRVVRPDSGSASELGLKRAALTVPNAPRHATRAWRDCLQAQCFMVDVLARAPGAPACRVCYAPMTLSPKPAPLFTTLMPVVMHSLPVAPGAPVTLGAVCKYAGTMSAQGTAPVGNAATLGLSFW